MLFQLQGLPFFLSKFQHRSEEERKTPMVDGSEERSGMLAIAPWATVGCPVSPTNLLPILLNTHHLGASLEPPVCVCWANPQMFPPFLKCYTQHTLW